MMNSVPCAKRIADATGRGTCPAIATHLQKGSAVAALQQHASTNAKQARLATMMIVNERANK